MLNETTQVNQIELEPKMALPQETQNSRKDLTRQTLVRGLTQEASRELTNFDASAYDSNDKLVSPYEPVRIRKVTSVLMTSKFAAKQRSIL